MTREEAAEAMYRAAKNLCAAYGTLGVWQSFRAAIDAYSTATPSPLPAEVARVLEAAGKWHRDVEHLLPATDAERDLRLAVRAWRSSQPEPLSARLAKLKLGSVVEDEDGIAFRVFANHTSSRTLVCDIVDEFISEPTLVPYEQVETILSEVS